MTSLWGSWTIGRTLGTGGLAQVVEAVETAGRGVPAAPIALKRLHRHCATDAAVRALFADEQAFACGLTEHARVATGRSTGEHDDTPYLAMVLAPGRDLRDRASRTPAQIATIMRDACDAVTHVHAHGRVHGDVNPGNLIVDDAGHAMLCDLGVTRPIGGAGPVRGTHAYMAPEQVRGERWTAATDVFALGVVLWELVAGARLFHRPQTFLSMMAVVEDPVPPLANGAMNAIAQAALVKDPIKRVPTPAALLALLEVAA